MSRLRPIAVAAGLVLLPTLAVAQDTPAPRTHTVKRGDTLWDISKFYYNDPFLWPEIYRVNTDVVEDPHWIYPGEVLKIPDEATLRARTADEEAAVRPVQPPEPEPQVETRRIPVYEVAPVPRTAVRAHEYLAAPFAGPVGGPEGAGRVIAGPKGGSSSVIPHQQSLLQRDLIVIEPPAGVTPVVGDQFIVFRLGPRMAGHGQVVEPVGVVQVEDATNAGGRRVMASVRMMFQDMQVGQGVIPMDALVAREDAFPAGIEPTVSTKVLWLQSQPLLPSIGHYMIVDMTDKDGPVTGDQISFVRPRGKDMTGADLPEEVIAIAQVHKVTSFGTSVIIIRVNNGGVETGTLGRLTAKMQ
jgi:hypothetical protein